VTTAGRSLRAALRLAPTDAQSLSVEPAAVLPDSLAAAAAVRGWGRRRGSQPASQSASQSVSRHIVYELAAIN